MNKVLLNTLTHPVCILLLVSIVYFSSFLLYPALAYIDDGWSLYIGKTLTSNLSWDVWSTSLVEVEAGRLRPAYLLYFVLMFPLSGTNPLGYWLGQAVVAWLTVTLMWLFCYNLTKRKYLSLLASLGYFLLPEVAENLFRLGTAEPRQVLFILLFLVWMQQIWQERFSIKTLAWGVVSFLLALLTKETSLLLLPLYAIFSVVYFISQKNQKLLVFGTLILFAFLGIGFYLLVPSGNEYASNFKIDLASIWYRLLVMRIDYWFYWIPLVIAMYLSLLRIVLYARQGNWQLAISNTIWQVLLAGLLAASLFFVVSWEHQLVRYYYLTSIAVLLFITVEIGSFSKTVANIISLPSKLIPYLVLLTIGVIATIRMVFPVVNDKVLQLPHMAYESWYGWYRGYQAAWPLNKYLLEKVQPNSLVFTSSTDYEVVIETAYYGTNLGSRPITVVSTLPLAEANHPENQQYVDDVIKSFCLDTQSKILILKGEEVPTEWQEFSTVLHPPIEFNDLPRDKQWHIVDENACTK